MKREYVRWAADQVDWLRENYPHLGAKESAERLGISVSRVRSMAEHLRLRITKEAKHRIYGESRLAVNKRVRLWVRLGLPVKYHVPEKKYTVAQHNMRVRMRVHDYIVGSPYEREERYVVYYDEMTERNRRMERYAEKLGFRVVEMEEE